MYPVMADPVTVPGSVPVTAPVPMPVPVSVPVPGAGLAAGVMPPSPLLRPGRFQVGPTSLMGSGDG
jgi:hypothetical protein